MAKTYRPWTAPEQGFLFPPSLKDFVPPGHVAWLVRDLVSELDMREIKNDYGEERGAPPYNPEIITSILLYAYTQGVYASRRIERACEERVDFKVVSGMNTPDFRTIAKFRRRHLEALGGLFKQVLELCAKAGLVKLGHVALDGSKFKANASLDTSKSYKKIKEKISRIEQEIREYFKEAERVDEEEDREYGQDKRGDELADWVKDKEEVKKRLKEAKEALEREHAEEQKKREEQEKKGEKPRAAVKKSKLPSDSARYSFTDPESKVQRARSGKIQGYNAQLAVDSAEGVIVAQQVTNEQNDYNQLAPMLDKIRENMGQVPEELSADFGYCSEQNLKILENQNVRGYVAIGRKPTERKRRIMEGTALARMASRLKRGGQRSRYRLRKTLVEPAFGIIKAARGFREFLMRGIFKVAGEFAMVCTAFNILVLVKNRAASGAPAL